MSAPQAPAGGSEVRSSRLVATLAVAGALAGLLIVLVHGWSQPRILAHQAEALQAAVGQVLKGPERTERFFVREGRLVEELPAGEDSMKVERVFLGFGPDGAPVGYAVIGAEPGFQDVIRLIFGYDPASGKLLGMKVLESKETPGLGDKIEKDSAFVGAFDGVAGPIVGVKAGAGTGSENEVDMITGATISARAVVAIINNRIEQLDPVLKAHANRGSR